jgi:hypothetical protein
VAEAIAPWLGNSARATEPVPTTDDALPFDAATAQFYEVHRSGEEGAYQYVALMLDAAGQTREVPLEPADGEELYDLFQLMEKFPLLETVYRKAALGLLDTLMVEERVELFTPPAPETSENEKQPAPQESHQDQN